jgi:hypothetical protein
MGRFSISIAPVSIGVLPLLFVCTFGIRALDKPAQAALVRGIEPILVRVIIRTVAPARVSFVLAAPITVGVDPVIIILTSVSSLSPVLARPPLEYLDVTIELRAHLLRQDAEIREVHHGIEHIIHHPAVRFRV